jgi:hypothetical protein
MMSRASFDGRMFKRRREEAAGCKLLTESRKIPLKSLFRFPNC